MSIVNISSENALENTPLKPDGLYNNSQFTVKFKKPLNDCVGVQLLRAAIPLTYNVINENADVNGNYQNVLRFMFKRSSIHPNGHSNVGEHYTLGTIRKWNIAIRPVTPDDDMMDELCLELEQKLRLIDISTGSYNISTPGNIDSPVAIFIGEGGNGDTDAKKLAYDIYPGWGVKDDDNSASKQRNTAIRTVKTGKYNYTDTMNSFLCFYDDLTRKIQLIHKAKKFSLLGYDYVDKKTKESEETQKMLLNSSESIGFNTLPYTVDGGGGSYDKSGNVPLGSIYDNAIIDTRQSQYKTKYESSHLTITNALVQSINTSEKFKWLYIGRSMLIHNEGETDLTQSYTGTIDKTKDTIGYRRELIRLGPATTFHGNGSITKIEINNADFSEFEEKYEQFLAAEISRLSTTINPATDDFYLSSVNAGTLFNNFGNNTGSLYSNYIAEHWIATQVRTIGNGFTGLLSDLLWDPNNPAIVNKLEGWNFLYYLQTLVYDIQESGSHTGSIETLLKRERTVLKDYTEVDWSVDSNVFIMSNESDTLPLAFAFQTNQRNKSVNNLDVINIATKKSYDTMIDDLVSELTTAPSAILSAITEATAEAENHIDQTPQTDLQVAAANSARNDARNTIINNNKYHYTTPGADTDWKAIEDQLAAVADIDSQTSGRLQKVFGYYFDDHTTGASKFKKLSNGTWIDDTVEPTTNGLGNVALLKSLLYPEPRGSKALFLRLMEPTLDQQNTETDHGDRIMIPLTEEHGKVQQYLANTQSEVIPFKVPTNLSRLTLRLEYGDENSLVGGTSDSLNGAHAYYRFKFYFKHQTNKT